MNDNTNVRADEAAQRPIPPIPGGGSWRFDEASWQWISNSPAADAGAEAASPQPVAQDPAVAVEEVAQPGDEQQNIDEE